MAESLPYRVLYFSVDNTPFSTRFSSRPAMIRKTKLMVSTGKWKSPSFEMLKDGNWFQDEDSEVLYTVNPVKSKIKATHEHAISPLLELNQLTELLYRQAAKRELTAEEQHELAELCIVAMKASGIHLEQVANMATFHYQSEAREILSDEPETSSIH
jgi:hypothetical protein